METLTVNGLLHPLQILSVRLNDTYSFDPTTKVWTALSAASLPISRDKMGFASTPDGTLYIFGGARGQWGPGEGESSETAATTTHNPDRVVSHALDACGSTYWLIWMCVNNRTRSPQQEDTNHVQQARGRQ